MYLRSFNKINIYVIVYIKNQLFLKIYFHLVAAQYQYYKVTECYKENCLRNESENKAVKRVIKALKRF